MKATLRETCCAAQSVSEALAALRDYQLRQLPGAIRPLVDVMARVLRHRERLTKAVDRGRLDAVPRLQHHLLAALRDAALQITITQSEVPPEACRGHSAPGAHFQGPSLRELVKELDQLRDEFGAWEFDRDRSEIVVTTDPIVLDDVDLGPFEIRLCLRHVPNLLYGHPYRIIALKPNPAASNPNIVHPHVDGETMCAGEATTAITNALTSGRLCDYFLLIRGVLENYNSASPYVALSEWSGEACSECGYHVNSDESYWCEGCERSFCGECTACCSRCHDTSCPNCLGRCPICEETVCEECLRACASCGTCCCSACLVDDLCPDCIEAKEQHHEQEQATGPLVNAA